MIDHISPDPDFPGQLLGIEEARKAILALPQMRAMIELHAKMVKVPYEPGSRPE